MTSVSAGHIILTLTQPVGSGRPQRESNPGLSSPGVARSTVELPRPPIMFMELNFQARSVSSLKFKFRGVDHVLPHSGVLVGPLSGGFISSPRRLATSYTESRFWLWLFIKRLYIRFSKMCRGAKKVTFVSVEQSFMNFDT